MGKFWCVFLEIKSHVVRKALDFPFQDTMKRIVILVETTCSRFYSWNQFWNKSDFTSQQLEIVVIWPHLITSHFISACRGGVSEMFFGQIEADGWWELLASGSVSLDPSAVSAALFCTALTTLSCCVCWCWSCESNKTSDQFVGDQAQCARFQSTQGTSVMPGCFWWSWKTVKTFLIHLICS